MDNGQSPSTPTSEPQCVSGFTFPAVGSEFGIRRDCRLPLCWTHLHTAIRESVSISAHKKRRMSIRVTRDWPAPLRLESLDYEGQTRGRHVGVTYVIFHCEAGLAEGPSRKASLGLESSAKRTKVLVLALHELT